MGRTLAAQTISELREINDVFARVIRWLMNG